MDVVPTAVGFKRNYPIEEVLAAVSAGSLERSSCTESDGAQLLAVTSSGAAGGQEQRTSKQATDAVV